MRELTELSDRELIIYTAASVERIDKAMVRVEKTLFGNGQPGLVTRIAWTEDAVKGHEKSIDAFQSPSRARERATIGGAASGFVALLLAILPAIVKGLPR